MTIHPESAIQCPTLPLFESTELGAVTTAFADAPALVLRQAWLEVPAPGFAPATVRVGWRDDEVLVFATMTDVDVRTRATAQNQRFWELGDTFEIFLRPLEQAAYVEFHVTPTNLRLQLHFTSDGWMTAEPRVDPFAASVRSGELFRSVTWKTAEGWSMLASIPRDSVCDRHGPLAGSTWLGSFSRYDATGESRTPIISSSSPHPVASFHRQQEWTRLVFTPSMPGAAPI